VRSVRFAWLLVPAVVGAVLGAAVDPLGLPVIGVPRLTAVSLLDGQAYFGRLEDDPFSDSIVLHDAYYFQDAKSTTMNTAVGLAKRGSEVHAPLDGMRIRRDKVLLIEGIGLGSQVGSAMATDRALRGAP